MDQSNIDLNPLQKLISAYAKGEGADRMQLAFAIDTRFAEIIRSTSEILIGQMRLTWWRDILTKPADERPSGEPLVTEINRLEGDGVALGDLEKLLEGWEMLLEDFPWDDRQFERYAMDRGHGFFQICSGPVHDLSPSQKMHAEAWALWDFARHCSDEAMREKAFQLCRRHQRAAGPIRFDRSGRGLSILCALALRDVKNDKLTADLLRPAVALRIFWHGLTGF